MEFVLELLLDLFIQVVLEFTIDAVSRSTPPPPRTVTPLKTIGWLAVGAILGGISVAAAPIFLLQSSELQVFALVFAPLASGALMRLLGSFLVDRGRRASSLATFSGGAAFAFGLNLVRFLAAH